MSASGVHRARPIPGKQMLGDLDHDGAECWHVALNLRSIWAERVGRQRGEGAVGQDAGALDRDRICRGETG